MDLLFGKIFIQSTIIKLKDSLDSIVSKHPKRTDLIESQTSTIENLNYSLSCYNEMKDEIRILNQNILSKDIQIRQQEIIIEKLQKDNKDLLDLI